MSTVDVIIPCYNYARYLSECVSSVLDQTGVEVRVLIIDDASTDETPTVGSALAASDSRVTYRRHKQNLRHIATYNEGIEWVRAKYYLLLSADDYLLPGALQRAAEVMDADESVGFCYGAAEEIYPDGARKPAMAEYKRAEPGQTTLMSGTEFIELCNASGCINIVSTPTAVVRTSLQNGTSGYRPELPHSGDMELWLRLAAHASVAYVGTPQAVYRRHNCNMSLTYSGANIMQDIRQRALAVELFIRSCHHLLPNAAQLQRDMLRPLALQSVSCASRALTAGNDDLVGEFTKMASQLSPGVVRTSAWWRMHVKRLMGRRASNALVSLSDALRGRAG